MTDKTENLVAEEEQLTQRIEVALEKRIAEVGVARVFAEAQVLGSRCKRIQFPGLDL